MEKVGLKIEHAADLAKLIVLKAQKFGGNHVVSSWKKQWFGFLCVKVGRLQKPVPSWFAR